jgi:hypothetical protein
MQPQEYDLLVQLIPMLVMSLGIPLVAYKLAREKGRNVALWTVLGAIPILNFICMWFFIGAANHRLEQKLDELNKRLSRKQVESSR